MNFDRLKAKWSGYRSVMTRLFQKLEEEEEKTDIDAGLLSILTERVMQKQKILMTLNDQTLKEISVENVEKELLDTDEYHLEIDIKLKHYTNLLLDVNTHKTQDKISFTQSGSLQNSTLDTLNPPISTIILPVQRNNAFTPSKLAPPTFDSNVLAWPTFWDSFESAVHLNSTLTNVQKFCYLKAQLVDQASATIEGFSLTNAHYEEALHLLKERYSQPHKIMNAYMQSLLELPSPENNLVSPQHFSDSLEASIRSLLALGVLEENYGVLLVAIVMKKLPGIIRQIMTSENGCDLWQFDSQCRCLGKEVRILEAGQEESITRQEPSMNKVHTNTGGKTTSHKIKERPCVFCYDVHDPTRCTNVTNHNHRLSIIESKPLCMNCLGFHHIDHCGAHSPTRCRFCSNNHHSSVCTNGQN